MNHTGPVTEFDKVENVAAENLFSILSLAFALGLVHALDTDHVIAVSTLASQPRRSTKNPRWYGLRWALGHGVMLLLSGVLVLGAGMVIPDTLGTAAESLVGLIMVGMGLTLIYHLSRRRPTAANLPQESNGHPRPGYARHQHGATAVGALHGMAGSAPLLALIPAAASGSAWLGIAYLVIFNIGVLISMLLCASALGELFARLNQAGKRALCTLRYGIAGGSIMAGGYLIKSVF